MFSYWERDIFKPKYDYLIIGSGFAGLWTAFFLKKSKPDSQIGILERGTLPSGASTKNAGFSCFGSPSELLENVRNIGWDQTLELTEKRYQGIQIIKKYFGENIDYNPCGATELFSDDFFFQKNLEQIAVLNENLAGIVGNNRHFYEDKEIVSKSKFKGFKYAISNDAEASVHSGKLFYSLYKHLVNLDVKFLFGTEVEEIDSESDTAIIKTKNLGDFESKHVCICTNAFSHKFLPKENIIPGRGQVIVTQPIDGLTFNRTFHFEKGYYYFKNIGNRVLFGGGRNLDFDGETTDQFGQTELIQKQLLKYLKENILPEFDFEIDMKWSGIMAFNDTKVPVSKFLSHNLSANVCMNGMGVALAPFLARDLVEGNLIFL